MQSFSLNAEGRGVTTCALWVVGSLYVAQFPQSLSEEIKFDLQEVHL